MTREIVLDTETTGLDPFSGHRVVEIGCVELLHHIQTGADFHCYINPQREMPAEAEAIHGLSNSFLRDKPLFANVADEFLEFIGDSKLVIHNAQFDLKFLNWELNEIGRGPIDAARAIDTVIIARSKFPGAQANLDALCKRFEIDLSARDKHGALLDSQLLAEVYLELVGGRQPGLELIDNGAAKSQTEAKIQNRTAKAPRRELPGCQPSPDEVAAHAVFLEKLNDPVWKRGT